MKITWKFRIEEAPGCFGPWRTVDTAAEVVAAICTEDAAVPFMVQRVESVPHKHDSDCTVDEQTGCCTGCGVGHGACASCNGRAFHANGCVAQDDDLLDAIAAQRRAEAQQ